MNTAGCSTSWRYGWHKQRGSHGSLEALEAAAAVVRVIKDAGMEPVTGNRRIRVGDDLPINKAFRLTVTALRPRLHESSSRGGRLSGRPAILFEGYLAARLTRRRVAICRFERAEIPRIFTV